MRVVAVIGASPDAVLRLATRLGECTAVAITADAAAPSLQQARVAGAKRLIRLWDPAFNQHGNDISTREETLPSLLAVLSRRIDSRLFLVEESADGWLGPALAEEMDLPHLTGVIDANLVATSGLLNIAPPTSNGPSKSGSPFGKPAGGALGIGKALPTIVVRRRCLLGIQRLRGPAIGVLSVLPQATVEADPKTSAKSQPVAIENWDLARLGFDAADLPRPLLRLVTPEVRTELVARAFRSLPELAERLRQDGLSPADDEASG